MATGYTIAYLEWLADCAWNDVSRPTTFDVFLYNDAEDDPDLHEVSGLAWLETEPNVDRVTFDFDAVTVAVDGNRVEADFGEATFDISNATQTVDAYGTVFEYDNSDLLVGTGLLESETDLSEYTGDWNVSVGADLYSMF